MIPRGLAPLVAAALLWSTIGLATDRALAYGSDPLSIGALRSGISGALSLVLLRRRVLDKRIALIGFAFTGPLYAIYVFSVIRSGIGIAAVLLYTAPAIVILLAKFVLGEGISARKVIALFLSFSGVLMVGMRGGADPDPVVLALGLGSSLAYSGIILSVRKLSVSGWSSLELGLGPQVWAAVELCPLLMLSRSSINLDTMIPIVYLAVFPSFVAYYLHAKGLREVEAGIASIVTNVEPIAALIIGAIIGESLGLLAVLGSALVISGAVIASLGQGERRVTH
ncbi:MAG: DMT family transporter [Candidatus Korarchaeum sp.]|nr:DMT family transporter [Candidatus Korarchaeum sp.]MDW8035866.1 DMT family transporter [Candidatus Korarchaeum sp.]